MSCSCNDFSRKTQCQEEFACEKMPLSKSDLEYNRVINEELPKEDLLKGTQVVKKWTCYCQQSDDTSDPYDEYNR